MKATIVAINNKCNIKCQFCVQYSDVGNNFSEEWIKNTINSLKHNTKGIILYGGEPTLHPKFLEIGAYAKNNNLLSGFMSNGILLGKFGEKIFNCFDFCFISLHGFKEIHNLLTRSNSWDKIIRNLNLFKNKNFFKLAINITITKLNIKNLDKFVIWLYQRFPYISLFNLNRIVKDGKINSFKRLHLDKNDYKVFYEKINILIENKIPIKIGIPLPEKTEKTTQDCGTWVDIHPLFSKRKGCGSWDEISNLYTKETFIKKSNHQNSVN